MTITTFYVALFVAIFIGSCGSANTELEIKTDKTEPAVSPTMEKKLQYNDGRLINTPVGKSLCQIRKRQTVSE